MTESSGVKVLMENEKEQNAIRLMVSMRNSGETLQNIADRLHADGIFPRDGRKWAPTVIRSIIMRTIAANNTGDVAKTTKVPSAA